MVNFEVNDIIRSSFISDHTLNQINDANYGIILAITTESVSIKWVMDDNSNVNTKYSSKNLENFDMPVSIGLEEFPIQKKVADNDWVDKDGNHYNDAGVKQ